jgi:hypothetical protein
MELNKLTKGLLLAIAVMLSACGKNGGGFTTGTVSEALKGGSGNGSQGGVVDNPPAETTNLKGFVSGGQNDGQQVLSFDPVAGEFLLAVPLGKLIAVSLTSTEIPQYPGTRLYTSDGNDGTKYIVLAVPLRYILRDVTMEPKGRLPNGDALPEMPGGELPFAAFAIAKNNVKIYLYVGMDSVGVFVEESEINPFIGLSWPIVNQVQQKVGTFALIPEKGSFPGGFFLGIHLDAKIARALDKFIR